MKAKYILIVLALLAAVSCQDFLNIQVDVSGAEEYLRDTSLTIPQIEKKVLRLVGKLAAKETNQAVKVSVACCIGRSEIDYVVETTCGEEIRHGKMSVTPRELIGKYGLDRPIFTSMCTFGLFGKYQKDKAWER